MQTCLGNWDSFRSLAVELYFYISVLFLLCWKSPLWRHLPKALLSRFDIEEKSAEYECKEGERERERERSRRGSSQISNFYQLNIYCVKSVRICSFSGPYFSTFGLNTERHHISSHSVRIRKNTDQKNFKYEHLDIIFRSRKISN